MKHTPDDIRDITYTPNAAVKSALKIISNIHEQAQQPDADLGVFTGLPSVDEVMFPGKPGHVIAVLGRTNHGKSQFMQWWARSQAAFICERERKELAQENQCVVFVTWEQAIEEMICFDLAQSAKISSRNVMLGKISDEQLKRLHLVDGMKRAVTPIYLIGHSAGAGKARPALTLSAVREGLRLLRENYDVKPRVLFLDYLQEITPEQGRTKEEQTRYNASTLKDIAFEMGCVVVIGTQAKRASNDRMWLPQIDDSEWTSSLEHTCDVIFGIWYPHRAIGIELGDEITRGDTNMTVTKDLFILGIQKQRWGEADRWWPLSIDASINDIRMMSLTTEAL